jgi:hypothetical protein
LQEIRSPEEPLGPDLAVQGHGQKQADHIHHHRRHQSQLDGEPIGFPYAGIRKQIDVIPEPNPVVLAEAPEIREAVHHAADQRDGIEADEQGKNRYGNQQKRSLSVIFHSLTPLLGFSCH